MEIVDTRKLQLQPQQQKLLQQPQQHFHVLAVDDSVIDMKLLERLLRGSSCKVTCVDSGDKALKYLGLIDGLDDTSSTSLESLPASPPAQPLQQEGIKVNLIMTDYCMPGMSGYDLLKRVKGSSWKDVPVVIMSSENEPSRISMCLEGGAEEFLLKPLQLSDLDKLQPYFLKSLDDSCQQESANSSIDSNNDNLIHTNNNSNNNNNSISKRKAMSPEPQERSRPKIKGLAVV
ncbi:two-component response regulator ORR9-like isoform X2 [Abrus precatorius]|uniref:Two-component response regulator ORR9-like isoform X2 n=1 Tax=Abrus precatorius TaxID=3816 RepID=A0A8B8LR76_ABRPR|nr:two-component response regulator ORR9-like isoform X2 [Abrus precatorius]